MKKCFYFILVILQFIVFNSSLAQIIFEKTYGGTQEDGFYFVQQTLDSGYIMTGSTKSFGAGGKDVYLVKTNSVGDTLWTRTFGGTRDDIGFCVQQTIDTGFIISGSTSSSGPGAEIIYLIKTNSNGDTIWTKTFKPNNLGNYPQGSASSVKQTLDSGYILLCTVESVNSSEVYLIKTNSFGDTLWTKSYGIWGSASSIQQTEDSGFIIAGTRYGYDVLLLKTDNSGNLIWEKTYGGSFDDFGHCAEQTPDQGYIVVGYQGSNSTGKLYLIKTNSFGDTLWTKSFGCDSLSSGSFIQLTTDSGYIIVGNSYVSNIGTGDIYLIKTDSNGDTIWTRNFGGTNFEGVGSVSQTSDNGFILAGGTMSFGSGEGDGYLIKTDANGNSECYEHMRETIVTMPTTMVSIPTDTTITTFSTDVSSYPALVNSGGIIKTCSTMATNEIEEYNSINIFPNPTQDYFIVTNNTEGTNPLLEIYNLLGEKKYVTKLNSKSELIETKEYQPGVYIVSVRFRNMIITKKLIIDK